MDAGDLEGYMVPDARGDQYNERRYFYEDIAFDFPPKTVLGFPGTYREGTANSVTAEFDDGQFFAEIYFTSEISADHPPTEDERLPTFETTATLVHCDRWVTQETSTMYRKEHRSTL